MRFAALGSLTSGLALIFCEVRNAFSAPSRDKTPAPTLRFIPKHLTQAPSRILVASLFAWMCVSVLGCENEPEDNEPLWTSLGKSFKSINRLYVIDERLLVASGPEGVFVQEPAVTGAWKNLGLAFPEYNLQPQYGITSLTMKSGVIIAGCFLPDSDNRERLYRLEPGDTAWIGSASPFGTANIWDVISTDCDTILAISTKGGMMSVDGGKTWSSQFESPWVNVGLYHNGPGGLFFSTMTDVFEPRLARSIDCGATWTLSPPNTNGLPTDGAITSIGSSGAPTPSLFVCLSGDLYYSIDWGDTFTVALQSLSGYSNVSVDPNSSKRLFVSTDSLYFGKDMCCYWSSFPPPVGHGFGGQIASDWHKGYSVLSLWDGAGYLLWSFKMDLAEGP